jgi:hypothetical protein
VLWIGIVGRMRIRIRLSIFDPDLTPSFTHDGKS